MLLASPDQPVSQPLEALLPHRKGVIHGVEAEGNCHFKQPGRRKALKKCDTQRQEPNKFGMHGKSPEGTKNSKEGTSCPKDWRRSKIFLTQCDV